MTCGALVGSFFNHTREDLYEQCSDHITEMMPSSVRFGARPSILQARRNSSGGMRCAKATSSVAMTGFS